MDIKNLETFVTVADYKSFTKAADKLGFTQSTISFQIKQLESELGSELFERINHKVNLTDAGEKLLPIAYEMFKLSDKAKQISEEEIPTGPVRIAIAESLAYWTLNGAFADFNKKYPGIRLKIITGSTDYMKSTLDHNESDLLYTLDRMMFSNKYEMPLSSKIPMHFVTGAKHPLAKKKCISAKELLSYPLLLTEKDLSYRAVLDEELAKLELETEPLIEAGDTHLILSLLKKNIGVSCLPEYIIQEDIKKGELKTITVKELDIKIYSQLFYQKNKWLTPAMKCVINQLLQYDGKFRQM